jgi:hypothetical protein
VTRRHGQHAAAALLAVALVGCADTTGERPGAGAGTRGPAPATATVERRDLVRRDTFPGTLGYGARRQVTGGPPGTLTRAPEPGAVVERGAALWDVDARPVTLLYGALPMFRALGPGDRGEDVRQLEENLVALGQAAPGPGLPDDRYDRATARAVRSWQRALARETTGRVEQGDVVVLPGPARVAEVRVQPGQPLAGGDPVLDVTGTAREVVLRVTTAVLDLFDPGGPATLRLPDGSEAGGTVRAVGSVALAEPAERPGAEPGPPKVDVVVALDDPGVAPDLDGAPVDVEVAAEAASAVLAVPVHALLARPGGATAVERVREGGTDLVQVEVGLFADGLVEVRGDLREGDVVVVAS